MITALIVIGVFVMAIVAAIIADKIHGHDRKHTFFPFLLGIGTLVIAIDRYGELYRQITLADDNLWQYLVWPILINSGNMEVGAFQYFSIGLWGVTSITSIFVASLLLRRSFAWFFPVLFFPYTIIILNFTDENEWNDTGFEMSLFALFVLSSFIMIFGLPDVWKTIPLTLLVLFLWYCYRNKIKMRIDSARIEKLKKRRDVDGLKRLLDEYYILHNKRVMHSPFQNERDQNYKDRIFQSLGAIGNSEAADILIAYNSVDDSTKFEAILNNIALTTKDRNLVDRIKTAIDKRHKEIEERRKEERKRQEREAKEETEKAFCPKCNRKVDSSELQDHCVGTAQHEFFGLQTFWEYRHRSCGSPVQGKEHPKTDLGEYRGST